MISRRVGIVGFTMVELVVAVGIIALLSGMGMAVFLDFRDKRVGIADMKVVEQTLREAQRKALAGERPVECGSFPLSGYQVVVESDAVVMSAVCSGAVSPETRVEMNDVTLSSTLGTIVFGSVKGGATAATITVCVPEINYHYQVDVGSAGSIEVSDELPGGC